MNSVWQKFTLSDLPLYQWRSTSYFYQLVGLLQKWRQSSWLMQWADLIGVLLIGLVFGLCPFLAKDQLSSLLVACGGLWLILTLSDDRKTASASPIHLLVLLYWSISTVATALSPVKAAAFQGWQKLTLYLLLFGLLTRILRSPRLRSVAIAIYLHTSLLVSVHGIRQSIFGAAQLATWVDPASPMAKATRVYSYLGNPNLLAAYLLPAVALSLAALFAWRGLVPKALALIMLICNSSCLVLTYSRGGWIGLLLLVATFLLLLFYWYSVNLPAFWRIWGLPVILGSAAIVLVLAVLFVDPVRDRVLSMFAGRQDSSNNFRINVWTAVIEMIRHRPMIGIGPGNDAFNKVYPLYQVSPRYTALSAYSILLEICVETGFIGLSCFLWLLIVTFNQGYLQLQRLRRSSSKEAFWLMGAIAAMLALLGHGLVDTVWYRPQVNTLWWLMVALIASYYSYQPSAISRQLNQQTVNDNQA